MPKYQVLSVFNCQNTDVYGITEDNDGKNLPDNVCKKEWEFVRDFKISENETLPEGVNMAETEENIRNKGYHITRVAALIKSTRPPVMKL
jgi:hypothetical protein